MTILVTISLLYAGIWQSMHKQFEEESL
jgi:hypothetical protein